MTIAIAVNREALIVGGRIFMDFTNILILHAGLDSNSYQTFLTESQTNYQVTGGTQYRISGVRLIEGVVAATPYAIGYGDTAVSQSAAAPTNLVKFAGGAGRLGQINAGATVNVGAYGIEFSPSWLVPASKYPVLYNVSGSAYSATFLYGYEV